MVKHSPDYYEKHVKPTSPYKFEIGDEVAINSVPGLKYSMAYIQNRYTSDEWNHPATPHRRYGVTYWNQVLGEECFCDFSEGELEILG